MVARHDDGDDSIGDRRSSSLASTWSDDNQLDMERWTVAGVERCRASRTDTAKGGEGRKRLWQVCSENEPEDNRLK